MDPILIITQSSSIVRSVNTYFPEYYIQWVSSGFLTSNQIASTNPYSLFIVDIEKRFEDPEWILPDLKIGVNATTPILILMDEGIISDATQEKLFALGADAFLIKPVKDAELSFQIKALLKKREKEQEKAKDNEEKKADDHSSDKINLPKEDTSPIEDHLYLNQRSQNETLYDKLLKLIREKLMSGHYKEALEMFLDPIFQAGASSKSKEHLTELEKTLLDESKKTLSKRYPLSLLEWIILITLFLIIFPLLLCWLGGTFSSPSEGEYETFNQKDSLVNRPKNIKGRKILFSSIQKGFLKDGLASQEKDVLGSSKYCSIPGGLSADDWDKVKEKYSKDEVILVSGLKNFLYLDVNPQGYLVYYHVETGIPFVLIPAHNETGPYLIAINEIVQGVWEKVIGENPSFFQNPASMLCKHFPVEQVSVEDCCLFCNKTGLSMPTDKQWFYASGHSGEICMNAINSWFNENSLEKTHPIMNKKPNKFGIYDMFGNVAEWCRSDGNEYIAMGGSWRSSTGESPYEYRYLPQTRVNYIGFRPCYTIKSSEKP